MFFATNVGFVHFDSTIQHGLLYFFHGRTNTAAEITWCFVRAFVISPECALVFHRAHAFRDFTEQKDSNKPDRQWQNGNHGKSCRSSL